MASIKYIIFCIKRKLDGFDLLKAKIFCQNDLFISSDRTQKCSEISAEGKRLHLVQEGT
jgi:hypothetical protein